MRVGVYKILVWLVLGVAYTSIAVAQTGVRGRVKTPTGEALPYAAIVVKGTANGTVANEEGRFELALPPGSYTLGFQFLGFQTLQKTVEVRQGYTSVEVVLTEQTLQLAEVQARGGNEDPAYSIMRRAIAKSRFHQLQVQRFTARVYTKSSVTVTDLPALAEMAFRKQLKEAEKESNFKVGVPMLNETVSDVTFQQPNTYRQRVVANRNSQGDFLSPSRFYNVSFYNPTVANTVSPLSPKAFAYYRFEYKGTFTETAPDGRRIEVSRVQVIPRRYGEGVFRGTISIIENSWAIHSLSLETVADLGLSFTIRHVCRPIQGVWMPTSQRYSGSGSYLGVKGHGDYVRNLTFTQFVVNPAFVEEIDVMDEKRIAPTTTLSKRDIGRQPLDELVKKQKEFSTRNLRQMVKEYEKQEKQARKNRKEDVQVLRNDSMTVDSLARRRSEAFWDSLRTVPLTTAEIKSYRKADSLGLVRIIKTPTSQTAVSDSSNKKKKAFSAGQLLSGHTWRLSKTTSLSYTSPLMRIDYNTVEGYAPEGGLGFRYRPRVDSVSRWRQVPIREWRVGAVGRYQVGRQRLVGYGQAGFQSRTLGVEVSGGRYAYQFNPANPISPLLNSIATLVFEQNLAKFYQSDFLKTQINLLPVSQRIGVSAGLEFANRSALDNYRDELRPWINWRNQAYTSNRPYNNELGFVQLPAHRAVTLTLAAQWRLGAMRYVVRNGRRMPLPNDEVPVLGFGYRKGMADVDYDFLSAQWRHTVELGIRSRLRYQLGAGTFLNNRTLYFPDFVHFAGNEFFLQQGDAVATYRLLPYYQFSTAQRYAEAHALAEFRQLLLTQLTWLRLLGVKENLMLHALKTPTAQPYVEVGYGLDGLIPAVLPFFRAEVVGQWVQGKYQGVGFRIGTTLKFGR